MLGGSYGFAQQDVVRPSIEGKSPSLELSVSDVGSRYHGDAPLVNATTTGDTLWYSDFENAGDWTFQNQGAFGWQIIDAGQEDGWYLATLNSESGGKQAEMFNDDPTQNTTSAAEHIMVTANPIDVSGLTGGAVVMFQQRAARFLDGMFVEVSNNGTSWTTIGSNEHLVTVTAFNGSWTTGSFSNPEYMAYHIPPSVVGTGNNNLWVRFRWDDSDDEGVAYGWVIDDVVVYRGAANDLDLTRSYYLGVTQTASYQKYSMVPRVQGENANFVLAAGITNRGDVAQNNIVLTVDEPNSGYNATASAITLAAFESDTVEVSGGNFQPDALGNYSVTYSVSNGNAEWIDVNNTDVWDFEVTENTWAYTDGDAQSANWYGDGGYSMCLYFDNFTTDTIRSIGMEFPQTTVNNVDVGLRRGDVISAFIYNTALDTILGSNDFYTIPDPVGNQSFINGSLTIPMEAGGVALSGSRDGFYACFSVFQDQIPMGFEIGYPTGLSLVDPDNAGQWFNPITTLDTVYSVNPMIVVNTTDPNACLGVNITLSGIVNDILAADPYEGDIDLTVSGNGAAPFTYEWTFPNGGTSSEEDIDGLTVKGTYTVRVTDVNGCKSATSFDVQGNIGVEGLNAENLNVYPNPADDVLTVNFGVAGNYNVDIVNLKGEVVSSRQVIAGVGNNVNFDIASIASGVYVVKVYNDTEKVTKEVVIK